MEGGKDVIMVAVDGGKRAEKAFERALEIANPSRHSIFIVVAITESVTLSSDVFSFLTYDATKVAVSGKDLSKHDLAEVGGLAQEEKREQAQEILKIYEKQCFQLGVHSPAPSA